MSEDGKRGGSRPFRESQDHHPSYIHNTNSTGAGWGDGAGKDGAEVQSTPGARQALGRAALHEKGGQSETQAPGQPW